MGTRTTRRGGPWPWSVRSTVMLLTCALVPHLTGVPAGSLPWIASAKADTVAALVALDHLSFHQGRTTIDIPHIEAKGTPLTAPEFRAILDPTSGLTLAQRLARLTADSIAAPAITIRLDTPPGDTPGQSITAHDVLLADVRAGKAATLSIRSIDGAIRSGADETGIISTGAVVGHAIDPTLALTIATGRRTEKDFPLSPIYGDLVIADVRLKGSGGQTIAIDRVSSGAFEGRPLLDTVADLVRSSEQFSAAAPADAIPFYDKLIDAALSFKLEHFQISGFAFAQTAGGSDTLKIRNILLRGLQSLKLDLFEVNDVALDADHVHMAMRSATLSNMDRSNLFGGVMARLMGAPDPSGRPFAALAADAAAGPEFKVSGFHLALPVTGADSPFPAGTVNVVDIPILESGESAARAGSTMETHSHIELLYDIPAAGSDPAIQNLRDAGLSHLDLTFGYRLAYDLKTRELQLDDLKLDGRDIASIGFSAHMGNLPEVLFAPAVSKDDTLARFAGTLFRDMTLTIVDHGLTARTLPVIARMARTNVALLKAGLKTKVDLTLPGLLGPTPDEAALARAIDGFLDDPGTLMLSIRSPQGLPFRDIASASDPAAIARLLDITTKTHQ